MFLCLHLKQTGSDSGDVVQGGWGQELQDRGASWVGLLCLAESLQEHCVCLCCRENFTSPPHLPFD